LDYLLDFYCDTDGRGRELNDQKDQRQQLWCGQIAAGSADVRSRQGSSSALCSRFTFTAESSRWDDWALEMHQCYPSGLRQSFVLCTCFISWRDMCEGARASCNITTSLVYMKYSGKMKALSTSFCGRRNKPRYKKSLLNWQMLPVWGHMEVILEAVKKTSVGGDQWQHQLWEQCPD
jgi:hypothetical protein